MGHRCCPEPCEPKTNSCSCDCEECVECCWAVGDRLVLRHTWEQFSITSTAPGTQFNPPLCWTKRFIGGSAQVDYRMLQCGLVNEEFAVVFAIDTSSAKGVTLNKGTGFYEISAGGGKYPLYPRLVLFCGLGDGDRVWAGASPELSQLYDLTPCIGHCQQCLGRTGTPACACGGFNEYEPDPCNAGAGGFTSNSPCWCESCVEFNEECGGYIGYCLNAQKSQECICSGNFYSGYTDPNTSVTECGFGCEEDAAGAITTFYKDYCDYRSVDVLEILPPEGDLRSCLWWVDEECCSKRKECIPPFDCDDVKMPIQAQPDFPLTTPAACPDDYPGNCDCNTSLGGWTSCLPNETTGCGGNGVLPITSCAP